MEEDVRIERNHLIEVLEDDSVPERIKYILKQNPFVKSENHVAMIRGIVNGEEGGRTYPYPSIIIINNKPVKAFTGSSFSVDKEYRRYMLGLMIPEEAVQLSENGITYGAGLSRDARPIYIKYLRGKYFPLPRFVYLRNARPLLESKLGNTISKVLTPICNLAISTIHGLHLLKTKIKYRNYEVVEAADEKEYKEVETILLNDKHTCQEEHKKEWFKWVLNAPISHLGNYQKLFVVYRKKQPVAFWMIKVRYSADIVGKYKNIYVGTITEWGTVDSTIIRDADVMSMALHYFAHYVDVIQTFTDLKENVSQWPFLKKEVGESNFFINVAKTFKGKYIGYEDVTNWRLRPAMADTMFD